MFFLVWQVLLFRLKKQTSKNVADTTFKDAINLLCSCGNFAKSTKHFFLHCNHFSNQQLALINKIKDIVDKRIFNENDFLITQTPLFGDKKLSITDKKIYITSNNSVFNIFRKIWLTAAWITRYFITLNCIYFRANIIEMTSVTASCLSNYYLNFSV